MWETILRLYYYRRRGTETKCGSSHFLAIVGVAGVMVSIVAFQAVDPGSIPGPRTLFLGMKLGWLSW